MLKQILEKKDKKVEYVELIYDLIFVYVIGRNNSLLHHIENGFVSFGMFFSYVLCTLAVIQIWNLTTYYINMFGRNSARDHIFMFVNMFLMYFLAEGTRLDWQEYHNQYHAAWALIVVNIAVQYLLEYRNHRGDISAKRRATISVAILFSEAALILLAIPEFMSFGTSYVSLAAIVFGMVMFSISGKKRSISQKVDFEHLSERAMLYVVFTFGEMIIAIASYFEGDFNFNSLYFSFMAFLIVVGLFLCYGVLYDHIIDREMNTDGLGYMLIHVLLIFALNNITVGLEFMRSEEVALMPKIVFLTISMLIYFVFMFMTTIYAKKKCHLNKAFLLKMTAIGAAFAVLMVVFREFMALNIAITVAFTFTVFLIFWKAGKTMDVE